MSVLDIKLFESMGPNFNPQNQTPNNVWDKTRNDIHDDMHKIMIK